MKLLVVSDSHGVLTGMEQAVLREQPDLIYHLGDCVRDADWLRERFFRIPLLNVAGNCDRGVSGPLQILDEVEGVRLLACHGHSYQVKTTLLHLYYAAREQQATLCLYGHTHIPRLDARDGIQFFNPGAAGAGTPCYGVVTISGGQAECSLRRVRTDEEDIR